MGGGGGLFCVTDFLSQFFFFFIDNVLVLTSIFFRVCLVLIKHASS